MLKLRYARYTAKIAIRWKLVSEEKDRLGKIQLIKGFSRNGKKETVKEQHSGEFSNSDS